MPWAAALAARQRTAAAARTAASMGTSGGRTRRAIGRLGRTGRSGRGSRNVGGVEGDQLDLLARPAQRRPARGLEQDLQVGAHAAEDAARRLVAAAQLDRA